MHFLKPKDVAAKLGVSASTIWRLRQQDKTFPRPVSVGIRRIAFVEAELNAWMASRASNRGEAAR